MNNKTPLKYTLMIVFSIPILILAISFIGRFWVNHSFVKAYDDAQYKVDNESKLLYLNFPESFVPYYNLGNVSYERKEYESAVGYYEKALSMYPDSKRECSIRINLALAYCNTIDFYDLDSQEKIDTALFVLYKARDVLLENGWAVDEGDDYRDKDAQQLKEDIDKMIERLKNPDQQESQDNDQNNNNNQDNSGGGSSGGSKENKQKDKLQDNKDNAMKERREEQREYQNNQNEKQQDQNSGSNDGNDQNNSGSDNGDDENNGGSDNGDDENNGGSDNGEDQNNGGSDNGQDQNNGGSGNGSNTNPGPGGQGESEGSISIKRW